VAIVENVGSQHVTVRRAVYVDIFSEIVGDPSSRQRQSSYTVEDSEKLPRSAIVSIRKLETDEIDRLLGLLEELRR